MSAMKIQFCFLLTSTMLWIGLCETSFAQVSGLHKEQLERQGLDGLMVIVSEPIEMFDNLKEDRKVIRKILPGEKLWVQSKPDTQEFFQTCDIRTGNLGWIQQDKTSNKLRFVMSELTSKQKEAFRFAARNDTQFKFLAKMGKHDDAIELGEQIRDKRAESIGKDHPRYADVIEILALIHSQKRDFESAISYIPAISWVEARKGLQALSWLNSKFVVRSD